MAQGGKLAVNSACEAVEGALAARAVHDRVVLNHYVTKSRAEYEGKMARGSAMGNQACTPNPTKALKGQVFHAAGLRDACTWRSHAGAAAQAPVWRPGLCLEHSHAVLACLS